MKRKMGSEFAQMMEARFSYITNRSEEASLAAAELELLTISSLTTIFPHATSPLLLQLPTGVLDMILSFCDKKTVLYVVPALNKTFFGRVSDFLWRLPSQFRSRPHSSRIAGKVWLSIMQWCFRCHLLMYVKPPRSLGKVPNVPNMGIIACPRHGEKETSMTADQGLRSALQNPPCDVDYLQELLDDYLVSRRRWRHLWMVQLAQEQFSVPALDLLLSYLEVCSDEETRRNAGTTFVALVPRLLNALAYEDQANTEWNLNKASAGLLVEMDGRIDEETVNRPLGKLICEFAEKTLIDSASVPDRDRGITSLGTCMKSIQDVKPFMPQIVRALAEPALSHTACYTLTRAFPTYPSAMKEFAAPILDLFNSADSINTDLTYLAQTIFCEYPAMVEENFGIVHRLLDSPDMENQELVYTMLSEPCARNHITPELLLRMLKVESSGCFAQLANAVGQHVEACGFEVSIMSQFIDRLCGDLNVAESDTEEILMAMHGYVSHPQFVASLPMIMQSVLSLLDPAVNSFNIRAAIQMISDLSIGNIPLDAYAHEIRGRVHALATAPNVNPMIAETALDCMGDLVGNANTRVFSPAEVVPLLVQNRRYEALVMTFTSGCVPDDHSLDVLLATFDFGHEFAPQLVGDLINVAPDRIAAEIEKSDDFRAFVEDSVDDWLVIQRNRLKSDRGALRQNRDAKITSPRRDDVHADQLRE